MRKDLELLDALLEKHEGHWIRARGGVRVEFGNSGRTQLVSLRRKGEDVVLSSRVLAAERVTKHHFRWNELALICWRRNAKRSLVNFCFDEENNLIGRIRHPLATLDEPELELYIETLAYECDRFEYLLVGEDVE